MSAPPGTALQTVGTRWLNKEEAGEPPALGQVWDEGEQRWMPLGEKVGLDRYRQQQQPAVMLAEFAERREMVLKFVSSKMREAEYGPRGALVEGKLHHYYRAPGSKKKSLTKTGAELLADLFRLRRASSRVTGEVLTPEFVSARVACTLVDQYGQPAGAHEAACSTAEAGFSGDNAARKYGAPGHWEERPGGKDKWVREGDPDMRAAYNDVVSRGGKRAYVGAVIVATATDDIFEIAEAGEERTEQRRAGAEHSNGGAEQGQAEPVARPPAEPTISGRPVSTLTTADLERNLKSLRAMAPEDRERWAPHLEAIERQLALRAAPDNGPQVLTDEQVDPSLVRAAAPEPPELTAVRKLADLRERVDLLLADESIPKLARDTWGAMCEAFGAGATLADLSRVASNLERAKAKAAKAGK